MTRNIRNNMFQLDSQTMSCLAKAFCLAACSSLSASRMAAKRPQIHQHSRFLVATAWLETSAIRIFLLWFFFFRLVKSVSLSLLPLFASFLQVCMPIMPFFILDPLQSVALALGARLALSSKLKPPGSDFPLSLLLCKSGRRKSLCKTAKIVLIMFYRQTHCS